MTRYAGLSKILRLIRVLERNRIGMPWRQLARDLQVSTRTVRRYVEVLHRHGARVRVEHDLDGIAVVGPLVWTDQIDREEPAA